MGLACAALLCAARASAYAVPPFNAHVTDLAGLLEPGDRARLDEKLASYQHGNGPQMALLILPTLDGDAIEDVAFRVFNTWKLGKKGRDDGLLVLVVTDDRRVRIEVGDGLEGNITDVLTGRVIRNIIGPAFRNRDYIGGFDRAFDALMTAATGNASELPRELTQEHHRARRTSSPALIVFFILFVIISSLGRRRRYGGWLLWGAGNALLSGRSGGGFFGGGGGGGFGGGGGGRSSGGGASGGW